MTDDLSNRFQARIACVQHGDYLGARRRLASGEDESYGGQRYSVEALERLFNGIPHLVVSLEAIAGSEVEGLGEYVNVPASAARWQPGRWKANRRASKILRVLEHFSPTHLLLRTNDIIGCRILEWANRRKIPTAVIIAARFDSANLPARRLCQLANDDNVLFVGNHNRVATASLSECGLRPEKAVAWDYPHRATPEQFNVKSPPKNGPLTVMFAGSVIESKGVLDLVRAVQIVRDAGVQLLLSICGEGNLRPVLQAHTGVREGWLEVSGSISSGEIIKRMTNSWVVVVPTRPAYPEALPLVIIEALSTRTPVILSDHPVFQEYFVDGRGVRLFHAGDVRALAATLENLAADVDTYEDLSEGTSAVWCSLQIEARFHDLLERFGRETGLSWNGS
jgi:glycosyltransferase involved in cell wall biosynthesis